MRTVTYTELFENYEWCWSGTIVLDKVNRVCTYGDMQCIITDKNSLFIENKFRTLCKQDEELWIYGILSVETKTVKLTMNNSVEVHIRRFRWND